MKASILATGLALCALAPSALATPLEARDVTKTKTITKTKTETETDISTRWRTRTTTETQTIKKKTTTTKTIIRPTTTTKTVLKVSTTTKVKTGPTTTVQGPTVTVRKNVPGPTVTVTGPTVTAVSTKSVQGQTVTALSTRTVQGPTVTAQQTIPASTVTVKGATVVSTSTKFLPGSTVVSISTAQGPTVTAFSSVQGPTVTAFSTVQGPTVTSYIVNSNAADVAAQTVTSWLSSACSPLASGPVSSNATSFSSTTSMLTSMSTSVSLSASVSASASAVPTQSYLNVKTAQCNNPKAYYMQIDNTGTQYDGTVLVNYTTSNGPWLVVYPPNNDASSNTPWPVTYDSATGQLQGYNKEGVVSTYDPDQSDSRWGMLFSAPADYADLGAPLKCNLGAKNVLDCSAEAFGVLRSGIQLNGNSVTLGGGYYAGSSNLKNATFSLVPACDLGSDGTTSSNSTAVSTVSSTSSASATTSLSTSSASASATAAPQQQYANVVTDKCDNPNAYFIQVDNTGTDFDGTVMVGPNGNWAYFEQPTNSPDVDPPLAFTLNTTTGQLQNYVFPDTYLQAYVFNQADWPGDHRNGMLVSLDESDRDQQYDLNCTAENNVLSCNVEFNGQLRSGLFLHDNYVYLGGGSYDGTADAKYGTFTLVPACKYGSSNSSSTSTTTSTPSATASASSTSSTSASATPQPTYLNVVTTTCDAPKAYYLQLSSTDTRYNGTVVLGQLRNWIRYSEPETTYPDTYSSVTPFTLNTTNGRVQNYNDPTFFLFVNLASDPSSDHRDGHLFQGTEDYMNVAAPLSCTIVDNVLSCGATFRGSYNEGLYTNDGGYVTISGGVETYTPGVTVTQANLTMVPACDL